MAGELWGRDPASGRGEGPGKEDCLPTGTKTFKHSMVLLLPKPNTCPGDWTGNVLLQRGEEVD